ncbi:MAG: ABC transporter substrate-binding protein [Acidimicrobiia bacterium]
MRRSTLLRWLGVAVVLTLAAAACDSDGDSSETSSNEPPPELTGDPITVVQIATYEPPAGSTGGSPEAEVGAQAAAKAINDAGGVNGSPIEVIGCDEKQDPNETAACARMAADEGAVAVVGAFTTFDVNYMPVLAEAGIPSVGNFAIGFEDFANEYSFPITGGAPSGIAGQAAILADEAGAEKIDAVFLEIEAGEIAVDFADAALEPRGLAVDNRIPWPPGTTDPAPIVAAAESNDPDGIVIALAQGDASRYIEGSFLGGSDTALGINGASLTQDDIEQLGDASNGLYFAGTYLPSTSDDPAVQDFNHDMDAIDENVAKNDVSMNSYASVKLVAQVAEGITGPVTAASLFGALNGTGEVDLGLVAPFSYQEPDNTLFPGVITRIFNPDVMYMRVEDGEITPITGDWVNPTTPPSG